MNNSLPQTNKQRFLDSIAFWRGCALAAALLLIFVMLFDISINPRFSLRGNKQAASISSAGAQQNQQNNVDYAAYVIPESGVQLPVGWGSLGKQMVDAGAIDQQAFEALYASRGGLNADERALLLGEQNGNLVMNRENANYLLNLLWAFGLANKNRVLDEGPMVDPQYGGADRFASTGGWTLASGDPMDHYSMHAFVALTEDQQALVERVAKGIFRPCCGNSTYFPDCNHGMAMLGLLQLMAANGASEEDMYGYALAVNSYWFPDTYLTLAKYLEMQGTDWNAADPKELLGYNASSAAGYKQILSNVEPVQLEGGGGCGV